jgi:predicted Zn-dependent protease
VILSRIARPLVLAHELGHYFSLPHGRDPYSIMNKAPRDIPYEERGFTKREYAQMRRAWRKMKRSAHLTPLR